MVKKQKKKKNLPKGLPETFVERLIDIVGQSSFVEVRKTFVDKPTTFRINTIKATKADVDTALQYNGFKTKNVPWCSDAYILQNRTKRDLTELDIYKDGKIYIQSLASMVPPLVLDPKPGENVLDLTAAPGSKTSQMAAMMEKKGELVANELNKVRFFRLKANMENLGVCGEIVHVGESESEEDIETPQAPSLRATSTRPGEISDVDPALWNFKLRMEDGSVLCQEYPDYFDKILLDAPCSGESRFIEGFPKTYGYWNEKKIKRVAYRQHKLMMAAWHALKPGGVLVYSTCTMAPEENEARVDKLLERVGDEAVVEEISLPHLKTYRALTSWKKKEYTPEVKKSLRILPTKEIEGFYVVKIRKKQK